MNLVAKTSPLLLNLFRLKTNTWNILFVLTFLVLYICKPEVRVCKKEWNISVSQPSVRNCLSTFTVEMEMHI